MNLTTPQRIESHPNIIQSENQHIVDDIRNKLCSAYNFIELAYEEVLPWEMREQTRQQALLNFNYLIDRLKEIK